jgi:hypothetical protein
MLRAKPQEQLMKRTVLTLALATVLVAACTASTDDAATTTTTTQPATTTTTVPETTTTTSAVIPARLELQPFGTLQAVPLLGDEPPYAGPATPSGLTGFPLVPWVEQALADPVVRSQLEAEGFAVVPGTTPLFHYVYDVAVYEGSANYVTTDAAYHTWHLVFDKVLRDTESGALLPVLERLVGRLVENARLQRDELAGSELADAADRVVQLFEAAAALLGLDVGSIGPLAAAEVALVTEHTRFTASPTTSFGPCDPGSSPNNCVDYSLFRPRGHYTRSPDLERYFRAMSLLGQAAFFMDADSLRLGILATRVIVSSPDIVADWQRIYEPTAFLVGAADDYTPFEVAGVVDSLSPTGLDDPLVFADDTVVAGVAGGLQALRTIQINPSAPSVRIMGVRFVLDSFVLDRLIEPNVAGRSQASPLDVAAAFGSGWAYGLQDAAGETGYDGYDDEMTDLRERIASRTVADWGATVYDAWLYAIDALWHRRGAAFPDYMQGDAWTAKSHQAGLGSYTELKHDTILYAKQAVAEGGGEEPPVPPRHWVEPDPVPFLRLAGVADLMREGLASRGLLPEEFDSLLADYAGFTRRLGAIASDELAGTPISAEDNEWLQFVGPELEAFWFRSSDILTSEDTGPDSQAALVADVMRAFDEVLELGTGAVDTIFVLVPDDTGGFQVAVGGVYSYYEFWWDASQRLTDEEWRALLEAGDAPQRPAWQEAFLAR